MLEIVNVPVPLWDRKNTGVIYSDNSKEEDKGRT